MIGSLLLHDKYKPPRKMVHMPRYVNVKLREEIGDLIDALIERTELGFSSRADVVQTAVREYYERKKKEGFLSEN